MKLVLHDFNCPICRLEHTDVRWSDLSPGARSAIDVALGFSTSPNILKFLAALQVDFADLSAATQDSLASHLAEWISSTDSAQFPVLFSK